MNSQSKLYRWAKIELLRSLVLKKGKEERVVGATTIEGFLALWNGEDGKRRERRVGENKRGKEGEEGRESDVREQLKGLEV